MADIGTVAPSAASPSPPAGAPGTPVAVTSGQALTLPPALAGQDRALTIGGQVLAQQDGQALVRTAAGDVRLTTPTPLPTNAPVILQIAPGAPQTGAQTITVLTQSASPGGTPATNAPQTGAVTTDAAAPPSPAATVQGSAAAQAASLPVLQVGVTVAVLPLPADRPAPSSPTTPNGPPAPPDPEVDVIAQGLGLILGNRAAGQQTGGGSDTGRGRDDGQTPPQGQGRPPPGQDGAPPSSGLPTPSPPPVTGGGRPSPLALNLVAMTLGLDPAALTATLTAAPGTPAAAPVAIAAGLEKLLATAGFLPGAPPPAEATPPPAEATPTVPAPPAPPPSTLDRANTTASQPAPTSIATTGAEPPADARTTPQRWLPDATSPPLPAPLPAPAPAAPPPTPAELAQPRPPTQPGLVTSVGLGPTGSRQPAPPPLATLPPSPPGLVPAPARGYPLNMATATAILAQASAQASASLALANLPSGSESSVRGDQTGPSAAPTPPPPPPLPATAPEARPLPPRLTLLAVSPPAPPIPTAAMPALTERSSPPPPPLGGDGIPAAPTPAATAPPAATPPATSNALTPQPALAATPAPPPSAPPTSTAPTSPDIPAVVPPVLPPVPPPVSTSVEGMPSREAADTPDVVVADGGAGSHGSVDDTLPGGPAPSFNGVVTALTPDGRPVVSSDRGVFLMQARADMAPGTRLTLTEAVDDTPTAAPAAIDPRLGQDWPALREALALLAAADPGLSATLGVTVPPKAGDALTLALTRFLAALKGGDLADWLGADAVALLRRRDPRLARLLSDDFRAVARQAAEPGTDGWRTIAIPFGQEVGRLALHVRPVGEEEPRDERARQKGGRTRRFMLEVSLSRLGPMQLDGMLWPQRFDLVIRSRVLLPTSLTRELHGLFANSLTALGYSGTLSFQTGAQGWLDLRPAPTAGRRV